MEASSPSRRKFALLIDAGPTSRDLLRPLLPRGLQLIQSSTGATGLDLLQRVPARFGLALVSLILPGLPGLVVIDTIRLFRPAIPVICLADGRESLTGRISEPCLSKLAATAQLRAQLAGALTSEGTLWAGPAASAAAVEQARAAFALSGDLNEAARELARGMPGNPAAGR
jgi:CheY-like chemotaxis protein